MESTSTALPDDINTLKALLLERDAQVAELRKQLSSRALEIEHLKLTIAKLRRMQFGRKSEKLDRQIEQLELRLEDLQADEGAADVAAAPEAKRPRREGVSRRPLPEHLEREERVHLPADDDCPDCGGQLKPLGEDVAEQLEYVRAHFRLIRHRRPKLACARCDRIVQAAAPSRPIDRGIPGPALLAHIAVSKTIRTARACTSSEYRVPVGFLTLLSFSIPQISRYSQDPKSPTFPGQFRIRCTDEWFRSNNWAICCSDSPLRQRSHINAF